MFSEGTSWAHIVTLLAFAFECAWRHGAQRHQPVVVARCRRWARAFLAREELAAWIADHGGPVGVVAWTAGRRGGDGHGDAPADKWGARLLMAAGGALGVALAFSLARF